MEPNRILIAGGIFLAGFGIFALLAPDALLNGDAAVYAQQIEEGDFSKRTVHTGYFWLGRVLMAFQPELTDYRLNLISAFFGALTLSIIYLLAWTVSHSRLASGASVLFLASNYLFVFNSAYAEVYISQVFFLLLAFLLWIHHKVILSGFAFSMAILITPGAFLAAPMFLIIQPRWKRVLLLGATTLVIVGLGILPHIHDYFFGGRGLIKGISDGMGLGRALAKEGTEIMFGFFVALPFLVLGLVRLARPSLRILALGVSVLWFTNFVLGERFSDVPAQLSTYCLLALIGGLGVQHFKIMASEGRMRVVRLSPSKAARSALLLMMISILINGSLTFQFIKKRSQRMVQFRETVSEVGRVAQPDYVALGKWSHGILFEHYLFRDSYTGRWIDSRRLTGSGSKRRQEEARHDWEEALAAEREIWLLDSHPRILRELETHGYTVLPFREIHRANSPRKDKSP